MRGRASARGHPMPLPLPIWRLHHFEATASSGWFSEPERRAVSHAADLDGPSLSGGLRYTVGIASVLALSAWLDAGTWGTRSGDVTGSLGVAPQLTVQALEPLGGPLVTLYLGLPIGAAYVGGRDAASWGLRPGAVVGVRATFDVGRHEGITIHSEAGWRANALWTDTARTPFTMVHQLHVEIGIGIAVR